MKNCIGAAAETVEEVVGGIVGGRPKAAEPGRTDINCTGGGPVELTVGGGGGGVMRVCGGGGRWRPGGGALERRRIVDAGTVGRW